MGGCGEGWDGWVGLEWVEVGGWVGGWKRYLDDHAHEEGDEWDHRGETGWDDEAELD